MGTEREVPGTFYLTVPNPLPVVISDQGTEAHGLLHFLGTQEVVFGETLDQTLLQLLKGRHAPPPPDFLFDSVIFFSSCPTHLGMTVCHLGEGEGCSVRETSLGVQGILPTPPPCLGGERRGATGWTLWYKALEFKGCLAHLRGEGGWHVKRGWLHAQSLAIWPSSGGQPQVLAGHSRHSHYEGWSLRKAGRCGGMTIGRSTLRKGHV